MRSVVFEKRFLKAFLKLPEDIQQMITETISVLQEDPFHPKLHTKPLRGNFKGSHSLRLGRDWRLIFILRNLQTLELLDVDRRKDIYR